MVCLRKLMKMEIMKEIARMRMGISAYIFLETEGALRGVVGIELIECNEIIEAEYIGHFIDINIELLHIMDSEGRTLNSNRKSRWKIFVDTYEELLNHVEIEKYLTSNDVVWTKAKIEKIDKDVTPMLHKARIKLEGEVKRTLRSTGNKTNIRGKISY